MHTSTWSTDEVTVVFNHNGDYSGDVKIRIFQASERTVDEFERFGWSEDKPCPEYDDFEIPFDAMKYLVARYIQLEEIGRIEDASPDEILRREW